MAHAGTPRGSLTRSSERGNVIYSQFFTSLLIVDRPSPVKSLYDTLCIVPTKNQYLSVARLPNSSISIALARMVLHVVTGENWSPTGARH